MSVDQMLRSMPASEITEWSLFDQLEPIGGPRVDYLFAQLAHVLYMLNVGKDGPKLTPDAFLPWFTDGPLKAKAAPKKIASDELSKSLRLAFAGLEKKA